MIDRIINNTYILNRVTNTDLTILKKFNASCPIHKLHIFVPYKNMEATVANIEKIIYHAKDKKIAITIYMSNPGLAVSKHYDDRIKEAILKSKNNRIRLAYNSVLYLSLAPWKDKSRKGLIYAADVCDDKYYSHEFHA